MAIPSVTNMARWSDRSSLSPEWNLRAQFASRFIRKGLAILDVGCGAMAPEKIFQTSRYVPVDVVARDQRTRVLDLNSSHLPSEWFEDIELALFLGVLEYLERPFEPLAACARNLRPVLCSYSAVNLKSDQDRRRNGWLNDMTTEDFESGAAAVGLGIIKRFVFNLSQAVYLLAPVGADIGKILPENAFHPTKSDARATAKRPLIVAGFLGRGNCGDEAIFQVIHETFTADFEIIASVDEYGAHQRFWEWYPYAASRIIHQCDLSFPLREPRLAGMLVGGGGVRMSFAADQVLAARTVGAPCAFAGTDIDDMSYLARPIDGSAIADYLGLFSYVGVRSASSVEAGRRLGRTAAHGADWALRLVTDQAADLRPEPKSVGLTLREFPLTMISYTSVREVRTLVEGLRSLGFDPYFLPFCPEDERFLDELGFRNSAPIVRSWWNPRRMKQIIACSGGILSLGRLHPLVFAASTRTPVLSVHPPIDASAVEFVMPKIATMCEELGVPSADSIGEALSVFETDGPKPSDEAKLRNSEARLEAMIEQLRQLFGVGRVAADHA